MSNIKFIECTWFNEAKAPLATGKNFLTCSSEDVSELRAAGLGHDSARFVESYC